MSAPTPASPEPDGPGLQRPDFDRPSPALLARADRGLARFLAQPIGDQDDVLGDGEDTPR
ncbi:hypothetical protein [Streptomyces subrutilus]|uniref:Uncharacterized protein n=1 Tax=Streptomyces subrutilus TaxID=36818 RepID=A0A1E5PKJ4_9ACTN|nr:hypothetical protein [Streptomyces subrutilus]OEJ30044.1 hypothetical protein BGK67_00370 [Streptomyces subrutilus]